MAATVGTLLVEIGADVARLQRDMGKAAQIVQNHTKAVQGMMKGIGLAAAGAFSVQGVGEFAKAVFQAGQEVEKLQRAFSAVNGGNVSAAADDMAFVRAEAKRLGLDLVEAGDGFKKIAAAARGTDVAGEAARNIFSAVGEAAAALGLSSEESGNSLRALGQMMSKGKVMAEELRGQLGESMPGAFQAAAKAAGVTTAELDKMLEQGKVIADAKFFNSLAKELHELYGAAAQADSSTKAVAELGNAWRDFKVSVGDMGIAIGAIRGVAEVLNNVASAINALKSTGGINWSAVLGGPNMVGAEILDVLFGGGPKPQPKIVTSVRGKVDWGVKPASPPSAKGGSGNDAARMVREAARATIDAERAALDFLEGDSYWTMRRQIMEDELAAELEAVKGNAAAVAAIQQRMVFERANLAREESDASVGYWQDFYAPQVDAALEANGRVAEAYRQLQDDIGGLLVPGSPLWLEATRGNLNNWLYEVQQTFANTGLAAEAAAQSARVYAAALKDMNDRAMETSTEGLDGVRRALRDYIEETQDIATATEDATLRIFRGIEDAFIQFSTTGKLSFSDMVDSILADLTRLAVQKSITGPLASLMDSGAKDGGWIAGLFSLFGGGKASGGMVMPGRHYTVGEEGPETLVMGRNGGYVIPNQGNRGGQPTIVFNVSTPDAASFRKSRAQIAGDFAAIMGRAGRVM